MITITVTASGLTPTSIDKDPSAFRDYRFDWLAWLPAGDTITASTWTVDPAGELTVSSSSFYDDSSTAWLSGGMAGRTYRLVNHITTFQNRQDDRTLRVKVKER